VKELWNSYKEIVFGSIEHFVRHKILSINPDPEYCKKEIKRLKVKVRRVYNMRKFGGFTKQS
jgi:hypothetical protein